MDTTPDRTGTGFDPATITTAITDFTPILSALSTATSGQWQSPSFIDGLLVKGLAAVAVYHPGLKVGQWEPLILIGSVAIIALESGIRNFIKHKSVTQAIIAATASTHSAA